jgi:acyl carrier protein
LEYLGRTDHQVKIRGLRIEPGEVEAALLAHPAVREAVVVAREDKPGDQRLVAYVVAAAGEAVAAGEVRGYLKGRLPEYLVPSAFVVLDALPLSPNGKIDRKALPAPSARPEDAGSFVAPSGPVEETVARIWAEVLGIERVGAQDNFFELGGHSLLATQVLSHLRQAFPVNLPLRRLFEEPTVANLARAIEEAQGGRTDGQIGKASTGGTDDLLSQLDQLSDEEVDRLLREQLSEEEDR